MDLTNPSNWSIVYENRLQAIFLRQHGEGDDAVLVYEPINNVISSLATPVGLVKLHSPTALDRWWLGCYFSAYLTIANQKTRVYSKKCSLKSATPLYLPKYGVIPYEVEFSVPRWIDDIFIVLYQFTDQSGKYIDTSQQAILSAVEVLEQREAEVKQGLINLQQQVEIVVNRDVPKTYDVEIQ